jgi:hypothetical protein
MFNRRLRMFYASVRAFSRNEKFAFVAVSDFFVVTPEDGSLFTESESGLYIPQRVNGGWIIFQYVEVSIS